MVSSESRPQKTYRFKLRRVVFVLTIALIVAGVAVGFFYSHWCYLPEGSGTAGPVVPREPFESVWTQRRVLLLGIGDSITAGYGVDEPYSYYASLITNPPGDSEDVQGIHLTRVMPNIQSLNLSSHGSNSIQHLQDQIPKLPVQDADVLGIVVITTGGNDIIHNYGSAPPREGAMYGATFDQARPWIDNYEDRLNRMLDEITARFPGGCHIFLGNIYDPTDETGVANIFGYGLPAWDDGLEVLAAYNAIIERTAATRENVYLVDIRTPFLGHGLDCRKFWRKHYKSDDPCFWYAPILEDPNTRGYDAIRRIFLIEMAKALNPPPG